MVLTWSNRFRGVVIQCLSRMGLTMRATVRTHDERAGHQTNCGPFHLDLGCGNRQRQSGARRSPRLVHRARTVGSRYIVDTFLGSRLRGRVEHCLERSHPRIGIGRAIATRFFLEGTAGQGAIRLRIVLVLMIRPK